MKLPKKVNYALLASLAFLNLVLRYPSTPHETGVDSFFIHTLATQVVKDGYAEWILNPLSYFGLYPLSYPSASPFLIAGFSLTSGLPTEAAILLISTTLGLIGMFAAFVMGREIKNDDLFAFAVAVLYSLAPRFLTFTVWTASSRNLFMALAPIFVWSIARTYHRRNAKDAALLVVFLATLMATHRLTILLSVAIVAYLLSYALLMGIRVIRRQYPRLLLAPSLRARLPQITLAAFAGLALFMLFGTNVLDEYRHGELLVGDEVYVKLVNLGASLGRSVGVALPLALAGVVVIVRERSKVAIRTFTLLSLLLLIPSLFLRLYTGFYILPFLAIAGAFGIVGIGKVRPKRRHLSRALLACAFASILTASVAIEGYETSRSTYTDIESYNTALYLAVHGTGTVVANNGLLGVRTSAYSGLPYLPVGGAGTSFQSAELLAFGFYTRKELEEGNHITRIPLLDLTIESDSPFVAIGIQAQANWETMLHTPANSMSEKLLKRYRPVYFLEDDSLRGAFTAYGNIYCSEFSRSVRADRYRIVDAGPYHIWFVYPPGTGKVSGPSAGGC